MFFKIFKRTKLVSFQAIGAQVAVLYAVSLSLLGIELSLDGEALSIRAKI